MKDETFGQCYAYVHYYFATTSIFKQNYSMNSLEHFIAKQEMTTESFVATELMLIIKSL